MTSRLVPGCFRTQIGLGQGRIQQLQAKAVCDVDGDRLAFGMDEHEGWDNAVSVPGVMSTHPALPTIVERSGIALPTRVTPRSLRGAPRAEVRTRASRSRMRSSVLFGMWPHESGQRHDMGSDGGTIQ